jgi:hypothetical protein
VVEDVTHTNMFQQILPIVTLVGGFLLGVLSDSMRDRRAAKKEERKQAADFQRETFLSIQEVLSLAESAIEANTLPLLEGYYSSRRWSPAKSPPQLAAAYVAARRRLAVLTSRVGDDGVTGLIRDYEGAADSALKALTLESPSPKLEELSNTTNKRAQILNRLNNNLGERIRGT